MFILNRLNILNSLNRYESNLVRIHIKEYWHIDKRKKEKEELVQMNKILLESDEAPIGSYIMVYHKKIFDDMLYRYCKTKKEKNEGSIIEYIKELCMRGVAPV